MYCFDFFASSTFTQFVPRMTISLSASAPPLARDPRSIATNPKQRIDQDPPMPVNILERHQVGAPLSGLDLHFVRRLR
jgi:hypothetical protein